MNCGKSKDEIVEGSKSDFDPLDYLRMINEEGEDEEDDIDEVDEEPEEDDEDGSGNTAPAEEGNSGPAPFQNLQLVDVYCFGFCPNAA